MVYLYLGTPGSGKSLHTSKDIISALKRGSLVVANFDINTNGIKVHPKSRFCCIDNTALNRGPEIVVEEIKAYQREIGSRHILVVIDECQFIFDPRDWKNPNRIPWNRFFDQHRKIGMMDIDVVLVTHGDCDIDKHITKNVEYDVIHRKLSNYGTAGFIISLFFGCNLFYYLEKWRPIKSRSGGRWFRGSKKMFGLYDTLKEFGV